jgi:hypothetical protein
MRFIWRKEMPLEPNQAVMMARSLKEVDESKPNKAYY